MSKIFGQAMRLAHGGEWLPSRYHAYLKGPRDVAAERDAIVKIMSRPERVREGTWSASSAGSCLRQQQFTYLGMPRRRDGDRQTNILEEGRWVHLRHQAIGIAAGYVEDAEVSVNIPEHRLLGTMDGVLTNGAILELKSIGSRGFSQVNQFGAKPEHLLQVNAYSMASGIQSAHIVYEHKDSQELKEIIVTRDEELVARVVDDVSALNEATAAEELHPMLPPCVRQEGFEFTWCRYAEICPSATFPKAEPSTPPRSSSDAA